MIMFCNMHILASQRWWTYAAFRLACHSTHCRFDDDICTTAQAPLAAEGWPSGKQRLANRSITLPLCPPRQITDSWILFNSGAMPLGDKAKAAWPLRAATLKQQAMITWHCGKAASGRLVWNQHKGRQLIQDHSSMLGADILNNPRNNYYGRRSKYSQFI